MVRGAPEAGRAATSPASSTSYTYRTEDIDDYIKSVDMLAFGSYHAVVGNPPYITVKDKQENDNIA